jgi:cytochrome b6-f complex iron-sulfur subunit
MDRKEFLLQIGVTALSFPVCLGILSACSQESEVPPAPTNVDLTIDVSTGQLSKNGGYIVQNGIIIARTTSGDFLAVSAACTHEGIIVQYESGKNDFYCSAHGSVFTSSGSVSKGPALKALMKYNTTLTGTSLRVFS